MDNLYSVLTQHKYELIKEYVRIPECFLSYAICSNHYVKLTDNPYFKEEGLRPYDSTLHICGLTFTLAMHDSTRYTPLCFFCWLLLTTV